MYVPRHFEENDPAILHALIRAHPLGALVAHTGAGLDANHIPFLVRAAHGATVLHGHLARANPMGRALAGAGEVLVIFQGPERFITPSWYATKRESGRVVPTWNFAVVHAYGRPRAIDDPKWVRAHLEQLTDEHEGRRAAPWKVGDAPEDFIAQNVAHLVGVEIAVTRLLGKWKVSQNRSAPDRAGVVEGLRCDGGDDSLAMAALVEKATKER
jgi:transcriptional regulator